MAELLPLIGSAVAAFAATDVDDIVVLATLFGLARHGRGPRARQIVAGQYLGIGALVALSAAAAFGLLLVPEEAVGLLGLVPLGMGVRGLVLAARRDAGDDDAPAVLPARAGTLGVAAVTIANGADNVSVYVPYFATAGADGMAVIAVVYAVLVGVWCAVGWLLGTRPVTARAIERRGPVAVPVVFVGLGVFILVDAGTAAAALDRLGL